MISVLKSGPPNAMLVGATNCNCCQSSISATRSPVGDSR
jgi:hypothetical protein